MAIAQPLPWLLDLRVARIEPSTRLSPSAAFPPTPRNSLSAIPKIPVLPSVVSCGGDGVPPPAARSTTSGARPVIIGWKLGAFESAAMDYVG
ncbi:hypothetical protein NL676_014382 [Syzygium grande]|nr:hypothetical protein NL676_014382 [Syzygium grande]